MISHKEIQWLCSHIFLNHKQVRLLKLQCMVLVSNANNIDRDCKNINKIHLIPHDTHITTGVAIQCTERFKFYNLYL